MSHFCDNRREIYHFNRTIDTLNTITWFSYHFSPFHIAVYLCKMLKKLFAHRTVTEFLTFPRDSLIPNDARAPSTLPTTLDTFPVEVASFFYRTDDQANTANVKFSFLPPKFIFPTEKNYHAICAILLSPVSHPISLSVYGMIYRKLMENLFLIKYRLVFSTDSTG